MTTLDIFSDPICPWCHIGKARLDAALAEAGVQPFEIRWRIFQLNPDMPAEGMDRAAYLSAKFGGPEGAREVYDRIAEAGRASGLDMHLDRIPRTPNTMDAHRLIRWAAPYGLQGPVVDQLFARYFEQGQDISDRTVLLDAAEAAGLERAVITRLLDSDADRDELAAEDAAAREIGVTGVPCFVIAGQHVVQGAQDSATWRAILAQLAALDADARGAAGDHDADDPRHADRSAP